MYLNERALKGGWKSKKKANDYLFLYNMDGAREEKGEKK